MYARDDADYSSSSVLQLMKMEEYCQVVVFPDIGGRVPFLSRWQNGLTHAPIQTHTNEDRPQQ